jgi:hypothetical protein
MVFIMTIKRELLKRIANYGDALPPEFIYEICEFLAQPEQEQEPVVKITSIHADGENLPVAITGVVLSDAVNIWDLPIKNNDLLFLAPPKREPLSEKEIEEYINSLRSSTVSEEYYSEE